MDIYSSYHPETKQEGHNGPESLTWSILYKWNGREYKAEQRVWAILEDSDQYEIDLAENVAFRVFTRFFYD